MDDTSVPTTEAQIDCEDILSRLDSAWDVLPEEAIRESRGHRERIIPHLIEAIRAATRQAQVETPLEGNAYFLALLLLWEFEAKEAFPAIVETFSLPGDLPDDLYGDLITEYLPGILATLGDQHAEIVDAMIDDQQLDEFVRWAAVNYFVLLARDGRFQRDDVVGRLRRHLRTAIDRNDYEIPCPLVLGLVHFHGLEARPEIDEAFQRDLIDTTFVRRGDVENDLSRGEDYARNSLENLPPTRMEDAIEVMRDWACYNQERFSRGFFSPTIELFSDDEDSFDEDGLPPILAVDSDTWKEAQVVEPLVRDFRVGRNGPCPCGSGKKFKKCCLKKQTGEG